MRGAIVKGEAELYPLATVATWRKFEMSRNDGAPNRRLYSWLNWEGLS